MPPVSSINVENMHFVIPQSLFFGIYIPSKCAGRLRAHTARLLGEQPARLLGEQPARLLGEQPARLLGEQPARLLGEQPARLFGQVFEDPVPIPRWRFLPELPDAIKVHII